MDLIKDYSEDEIKNMIHIYEKYNKTKEYRKEYYRNKYQNDTNFKNKKIEANRKYLRKLKLGQNKE